MTKTSNVINGTVDNEDVVETAPVSRFAKLKEIASNPIIQLATVTTGLVIATVLVSRKFYDVDQTVTAEMIAEDEASTI